MLDDIAPEWDDAIDEGHAALGVARARADRAREAVEALEAIEPAKYGDPPPESRRATDDDDEEDKEIIAAQNALRHATELREARDTMEAAEVAAEMLHRRVATSELRPPDYWQAVGWEGPSARPKLGQVAPSYEIYPGMSITPVDTVHDRFVYDALNTVLNFQPRRSKEAKKGKPPSFRMALAWRIEHPSLWGRYADERDALRRQRRAGKWPQEQKPLQLRKEFTDSTAGLRTRLDSTVGETYLLHGAKAETVLALCCAGTRDWYDRPPLPGLGCGVGGLTDDPLRCDQDSSLDAEHNALPELHTHLYADTPHPGGVHYAVLCRVAVGALLRTHDAKALAGSNPAEPVKLFPKATREDPRGPYREGGRDVALRIPGTDCSYHSIAIEPRPKAQGPLVSLDVRSFNADRVLAEFLIAYWRE